MTFFGSVSEAKTIPQISSIESLGGGSSSAPLPASLSFLTTTTGSVNRVSWVCPHEIMNYPEKGVGGIRKSREERRGKVSSSDRNLDHHCFPPKKVTLSSVGGKERKKLPPGNSGSNQDLPGGLIFHPSSGFALRPEETVGLNLESCHTGISHTASFYLKA